MVCFLYLFIYILKLRSDPFNDSSICHWFFLHFFFFLRETTTHTNDSFGNLKDTSLDLFSIKQKCYFHFVSEIWEARISESCANSDDANMPREREKKDIFLVGLKLKANILYILAMIWRAWIGFKDQHHSLFIYIVDAYI